jgi:hypothetical protein
VAFAKLVLKGRKRRCSTPQALGIRISRNISGWSFDQNFCWCYQQCEKKVPPLGIIFMLSRWRHFTYWLKIEWSICIIAWM